MAAVNVTINGVICDLYGRTITGPVKIVGEAMYSDLGVGGGPIDPGSPPGIWGGGNVPMPNPPIANVPGAPGYRPSGDHIWGGGNVPMPQPPIANVPGLPPTTDPPPIDPATPPIEWKAVWAGPENGWVVVGVPQFPHPTPSA